MALRFTSAAVGFPLLLLVIWLGPPWFSLVVASVAAIGALELCHMASKRSHRPVAFVAIIWTLALVTTAHILSEDLSNETTAQALVGIVVFSYLVWQVQHARGRVNLRDWGTTAGIALLTGGFLCYAPNLRELDQGREWVFFLVIVTFATDTSAFVVGRNFGKRSLAPTISPGKTWEGAVAGLLGSMAVSAISSHLFDLNMSLTIALILGTLMGVVGQLGDLAESWLKRVTGVKDSGWLIPGHGGVLDRLDSIVFNLVLVYYFAIWAVQ